MGLAKIRDEDHFKFGGDGALAPMPNPALFGFRKDRFTEDSYIWVKGKEVWISFIECKQKGQGHFKELVRTIEHNGYVVAVPTPLGHMEAILRKWGWQPTYEPTNSDFGDVEVWRKPNA